MVVGSTQVETTLVALKIAFLVLLYAFIWRIVRAAGRGLRQSRESVILRPPPSNAPALVVRRGRLVVAQSLILDPGAEFELDSVEVTVGRGGQNDVVLEGDEFASARHVRFEPRTDGVWVHDLGSTNGTFVNGARIDESRRLDPGDVVRVGETDLRFEA